MCCLFLDLTCNLQFTFTTWDILQDIQMPLLMFAIATYHCPEEQYKFSNENTIKITTTSLKIWNKQLNSEQS